MEQNVTKLQQDENNVQLSGVIVSRYKLGPALVTVLKIRKSRNGKIYTDFPRVIWFDDNAEKIQNMPIFSRVKISGYVYTRLNINSKNGRKFECNIIGQNIEEWAIMTDDMYNEINFTGTVNKVLTINEKFAIVKIKTSTNNGDNYIDLRTYANLRDFAINQLVPGDRIKGIASVETVSYDNEDTGKKTTLTSFVCQGVQKI